MVTFITSGFNRPGPLPVVIPIILTAQDPLPSNPFNRPGISCHAESKSLSSIMTPPLSSLPLPTR